MRLPHFTALALLAVMLAPVTRAETVLVLWGDSLICGFGADATTGTPYGPAPFGEALEGARRWDPALGGWRSITHEQNFQGLGADLAYGAAAGWLVLHPNSGPVYVVSYGLPGADVTPRLRKREASWAPGVEGSALETFLHEHLRPALASLQTPRVAWICGSAGNNSVPSWSRFQADLDATWAAILAQCPGRPRTLMARSYLSGASEARSAIMASGHVPVDLDPLPARTDGLQPDGVHLTHFGNIYAGYRVSVLARIAPRPPAIQVPPTTVPRVAARVE